MKKILCTLLLLAPVIVFAENENVATLNWSDFCPPAFVNVKEPKGLAKINASAAYWYQRRVDFEKALEECKALEDNVQMYACYEELKAVQYRENNNYNARMEASENATSGIHEMNNMTNTMMPLNNYLNTFTRFMPSEVQ